MSNMNNIFAVAQSGEFAGQFVRVTNETPKRVSVLDVIGIACGVPMKNTATRFQNLVTQNPEVLHAVENFKFSGRGQRDTPVADAAGIVLVIMLLPGTKAAKFRAECASTLVRILGGDESLVEELRANRAEAQANPHGTAAFFAASIPTTSVLSEFEVPADRRLVEFDLTLEERRAGLEERRAGLIRMCQEAAEARMGLLVRVLEVAPSFGLDNDPRFQCQLRDELRNLVDVSGAHDRTAIAAAAPSAPVPEFVTVADYLRREYGNGRDVDTRIVTWVGKQAGTLYMHKHGRRNTTKALRVINGDTREVNVFGLDDIDLLEQAVGLAIDKRIFDPVTRRYQSPHFLR